MMIRWSPEAAADFAAIVEYIRKENPSAAERVARTIYDGVASLASFPKKDVLGAPRALGNWCFRRFHLSLFTG
jgi:plasmid stabilization system protein ParE